MSSLQQRHLSCHKSVRWKFKLNSIRHPMTTPSHTVSLLQLSKVTFLEISPMVDYEDTHFHFFRISKIKSSWTLDQSWKGESFISSLIGLRINLSRKASKLLSLYILSQRLFRSISMKYELFFFMKIEDHSRSSFLTSFHVNLASRCVANCSECWSQ